MPCFALTAKLDDQKSSSYVAQSNRDGDLSCQVCVKAVYMRTQAVFLLNRNSGRFGEHWGLIGSIEGLIGGTLALPTAFLRNLLNSIHGLHVEQCLVGRGTPPTASSMVGTCLLTIARVKCWQLNPLKIGPQEFSKFHSLLELFKFSK